jgi:hypothetical protein
MKCILTGCEEEVARGRMWFCEDHYAEAKRWWERYGWGYSTGFLAHALQKIGTTVDDLVRAIEKPWNYPEEAYWYHTRDEHKDMMVAARYRDGNISDWCL